MKILYINNDGGGFADYIDVALALRSMNCSTAACHTADRKTI